ncbi:unnamed protein product [Meloidogyne enterolobii]|uniref:Uncharacterized protein n=1 Tax=Meloidogyne enterolobii TaxID=390850 RepID=A0ACB1ALE5_MELEN
MPGRLLESIKKIFLIKKNFFQRSNYPTIQNIVKETPLVFVNVDEFVDFPRPINPNVVYIGGLGFNKITTTTTLKEPYLTEINKGKGTIYFSLGSLLNTFTLPNNFMKNLFASFGSLKEWHFIVKISEGDEHSLEMSKNYSNVFLTSWAPQRAILGKFFV